MRIRRRGACMSTNPGKVRGQLGVRWEFPSARVCDMSWGQEKAYFAPGDVLVLYSDGLIEAENGVRELFGRQGLLACARSRVGHTAVQIKEGIINDVQKFTGDGHLLDDLVLLVGSRELRNDQGVNNIMLR